SAATALFLISEAYSTIASTRSVRLSDTYVSISSVENASRVESAVVTLRRRRSRASISTPFLGVFWPNRNDIHRLRHFFCHFVLICHIRPEWRDRTGGGPNAPTTRRR